MSFSERALFLVRAKDIGDGERPADLGPVAPASWTREPQGDTGWTILRRPDGTRIAVWLEHDLSPADSLFAVFGTAETLIEIEAMAIAALSAREAWRRRTEPAIRAHLRRWRTWKSAGFERIEGNPVPFDGVHVLIDIGGQLPDPTVTPLPWNLAADGSLTTQELARYRITRLDRPAQFQTEAGHSLPMVFDDEPDPGA